MGLCWGLCVGREWLCGFRFVERRHIGPGVAPGPGVWGFGVQWRRGSAAEVLAGLGQSFRKARQGVCECEEWSLGGCAEVERCAEAGGWSQRGRDRDLGWGLWRLLYVGEPSRRRFGRRWLGSEIGR